jgi:hypothetical protein
VPAPVTKNGPAKCAQKWPWTGTWVAQTTPPPMSPIPSAMTALAEVLVTSICDRPAKATEVSEAVSQATPVFRAEYPSTCCMYRVPTNMNV